MAATMTSTMSTSNLRNSARQTRTNPTRTTRTIGSTLRQNSIISHPPTAPAIASEPPGFYPAITHFTDAITALPRDYRRHTSLLKEVDAKAWAPEENLQKLLANCLAAKPSRDELVNLQNVAGESHTGVESTTRSAANSVLDNASVHSQQSTNPTRAERRDLFASLRHNLMVMMVTMDEKNHVINNANEELSRHLRRLQGSYPAIADEVSDDARLGSLKHWAYFETNPTRKVGGNSDRRQAAASLAVMQASEAAERSQDRRDAVLARKQRLNHLDSDFDEAKTANKKPQVNGKNRRIGEIAAETAGLGTSGATGQKRKKTEKSAAGVATMDRSLSVAGAGGHGMSREPSQQESGKKRKGPTSNPVVARKRLNAGIHDSPKLVSSPLAGAFGKDAYKKSPVPGFARPASARARQNSTHNIDTSQARPSSSASRKNAANGNGFTASTPEINNVVAMTGKSSTEVKNTMKEFTNQRGERLIEDNTSEANGNPVRGAILLQRTSSKQGSLKRETNASEERGAASPRIPPPLLTTDLKGERLGRNRASKTSTPITSTFAESPEPQEAAGTENGNGNSKPKRVSRPRMKDHGLHDSLSPKALPPKRSHKKGAGLLAQQQLAQRQAKKVADDAAPSSVADGADGAEEGEEDDEINPDGVEEDERYCYCNDISYGEMVGCDNGNCEREWFHLRCVGLEKAPGKNVKWFCDECKDLMKKSRFGSVGGNGTR